MALNDEKMSTVLILFYVVEHHRLIKEFHLYKTFHKIQCVGENNVFLRKTIKVNLLTSLKKKQFCFLLLTSSFIVNELLFNGRIERYYRQCNILCAYWCCD